MKYFISHYTLKRRDSDATQAGALLKVVDESGRWGVADICPLLHFGDSPIEIETKQQGPLFQRALALATKDLLARKNSVQLVEPEAIATNFLVLEYRQYTTDGIIKIKADNQFDKLLPYLQHRPLQKIRLDFNGKLGVDQFDKLIPQLPSNIEYIEDPTVWNGADWKKWNQKIPLAMDFCKVKPFDYLNTWTYLIIKPSRENAEDLIRECKAHSKKYTLTSAMEHPVGFAHGLHYAQNYAENPSGFSTLCLFEDTSFHKYFETKPNSVLKKDNGFGIGMSEELEKLEWVALL